MAFLWLCVTLLLMVPCGAQIFGGITILPPNSPSVWHAARIAMTLLNEHTKDFYSLEKVISAKGQVVSGYIYYLEVEVGRCKKQNEQMTSCPQDSNTKTLLCDLSLLEVPWENKNTLLKSQCQDA